MVVVVVVCSIVLARASCLMPVCPTPRIHCSARHELAGWEEGGGGAVQMVGTTKKGKRHRLDRYCFRRRRADGVMMAGRVRMGDWYWLTMAVLGLGRTHSSTMTGQ